MDMEAVVLIVITMVLDPAFAVQGPCSKSNLRSIVSPLVENGLDVGPCSVFCCFVSGSVFGRTLFNSSFATSVKYLASLHSISPDLRDAILYNKIFSSVIVNMREKIR